MRRPASILLMILTLCAAVAIVVLAIWKSGGPLPVKRIGFQDADVPLVMPVQGEVDHRFQFLSAWQMAEIPLALRFDPPLGTGNAGLVYNAQKFWEMNDARGGHHTGDDLNGIGGMNTDLGDPVFCTADGLVLYAGEPSSGWGKTVVVAHRTKDGRTLHSMYAHLDRIDVALGSLIARGGKVGTVGTANGHYPAHLHFEIRESDNLDIGPGYTDDPLNRLDPMGTVKALRNSADDDLAPSPLARALVAGAAPWTRLEIQGAERLSELPAGKSGP